MTTATGQQPAGPSDQGGQLEGRVALVTGGTRGIGNIGQANYAASKSGPFGLTITGQIWAVNGGLDM